MDSTQNESYSSYIDSYYQDETLRGSPTIRIGATSLNDSTTKVERIPAGDSAKQTWGLIVLRIISTIVGVGLVCCIITMEIYMLLRQKGVVILALFVSRIIHISFAIILLLSDWGVPPKIHTLIPIYGNEHSWKPLGISQIILAFFVLGDSTLATMKSDNGGDKFADVLFPLVITAGCLQIAVGLTYFVIGLLGGARIKEKRAFCNVPRSSMWI